MGLFVAAMPELVKEKRKNKKQGEKRDVEKRTEVVLEKWRREAMNARQGERKGTNIHAALLLLANRCSLSICAPQTDSEVITSCAWRQQRGDVAQALIRRALAR